MNDYFVDGLQWLQAAQPALTAGVFISFAGAWAWALWNNVRHPGQLAPLRWYTMSGPETDSMDPSGNKIATGADRRIERPANPPAGVRPRKPCHPPSPCHC